MQVTGVEGIIKSAVATIERQAPNRREGNGWRTSQFTRVPVSEKKKHFSQQTKLGETRRAKN